MCAQVKKSTEKIKDKKQENPDRKASEFDSLVIGGGLSGLLVARQLEKTGRRVALIEALDLLGGHSRSYFSPVGPIDHGLKFFPATDQALAALTWLQDTLGYDIEITQIDAAPTTYDNGKFQPFVGFGDSVPEAAGELDYYSYPSRLVTSQSPKDWVASLAAEFQGQVFLQSHVTRLQFTDDRVTEVLLNGTKKVTAAEFFYCGTPQHLAALLPDTAATPRQRSRLNKGKFFTAIYLDMIHSRVVTDTASLHVLKGANEEPLVGVFHEPQPRRTTDEGTNTAKPPVQHSQWLTFVPIDLTDDNEVTATALKKIKRQVKRAYETSVDDLIFERILVSPGSYGEIAGLLGENQMWPKCQNLWIAGAFFNSNRNLVGTIEQCRAILSQFTEESAEKLADGGVLKKNSKDSVQETPEDGSFEPSADNEVSP